MRPGDKRMRIATWNINSVRLRLDLVLHLIAEQRPDVLCLQETKTIDDTFPAKALAAAGYPHQQIAGMKGYNGVAILSKLPLSKGGVQHWHGREDCRHVYAELPGFGTYGPIEVHCCYVPAGGDEPDPVTNPKFAHKLGFLDEQRVWWEGRRQDQRAKILVGDLNVAPLEHDVWSHRQMRNIVSHTEIEIEKLGALQAAHDWVDAIRHFVPAEQKCYTWWSYRAADWLTSDRGRRLDHIWVTPNLTPALRSITIVKDARGWEPKPSDHVPVVLEIG